MFNPALKKAVLLLTAIASIIVGDAVNYQLCLQQLHLYRELGR